MRITIVRDGESASAEVSDDLASVTVGGRSYPVRVVARSPLRIDLEIAGEKVSVEGWPDRYPSPPAPVDVAGERWTVSVEAERAPGAATGPSPPSAAVVPEALPPLAPGAAPIAGGVPVLPPMPGKIVELRVRDGERVARGQVLLVLEAMKMRNEIASPAEGVVRGLAVAPGTNVRARETMLVVAPA
ncbi:MAG TPA: biotin/lipoyl-containing protein [Thermoplasmata archaeon]|nr:biotin/lipoyl-containing protein [Thermoplasmata archaeon]